VMVRQVESRAYVLPVGLIDTTGSVPDNAQFVALAIR
jgi:hypothetical protein